MIRYDVRETTKAESQVQVDFKSQSGSSTSIRTFDIVVGLPQFETTETVRAFAGLPFAGQPNPNNPNQICSNVHVVRNSPVHYEATVTYTQDLGGTGGGGGKGNSEQPPTLQPPVISYSNIITEEQVDEDIYGHAILTKTGESFEPRIRRPFGDLVALVEVNVPSYDAITANGYLFKTNSDMWNGRVPPGQGLCTNCGADVVFDAQLGQYFRKKVAVQIREQGRMSSPDKAWWWRQLAAGHQWFVPREGAGLIDPAGIDNLEWCVDWRGFPTGVPQLHDPETGRPFLKKNKNNQWVVDYSPSRAKFYEYAIYYFTSFAGLLS